ncbi:MAG: hypothetical protein KDB51_14510, partial [Propionibacteriaceae bacterium]|nr:hypothetical protein [Propionibacteriaceae bacterium]
MITVGTAAVVPAITEQVRLDPCSAIDPSSATTTAHLSTSPTTGFSLPKWGSPRHQSLHSAAQTIPATVKALY